MYGAARLNKIFQLITSSNAVSKKNTNKADMVVLEGAVSENFVICYVGFGNLIALNERNGIVIVIGVCSSRGQFSNLWQKTFIRVYVYNVNSFSLFLFSFLIPTYISVFLINIVAAGVVESALIDCIVKNTIIILKAY